MKPSITKEKLIVLEMHPTHFLSIAIVIFYNFNICLAEF